MCDFSRDGHSTVSTQTSCMCVYVYSHQPLKIGGFTCKHHTCFHIVIVHQTALRSLLYTADVRFTVLLHDVKSSKINVIFTPVTKGTNLPERPRVPLYI